MILYLAKYTYKGEIGFSLHEYPHSVNWEIIDSYSMINVRLPFNYAGNYVNISLDSLLRILK